MVLGVSGIGGIPGTPLCPGDSGEGRDSSGRTGMGESQGVLCVLGTQGRGGTAAAGLGWGNPRESSVSWGLRGGEGQQRRDWDGGIPGSPLCPGDSGEEKDCGDSSGGIGTARESSVSWGRGGTVGTPVVGLGLGGIQWDSSVIWGLRGGKG